MKERKDLDLWLRFREAEQIDWDLRLNVESQDEWFDVIVRNKPISSILWPSEPMFPMQGKRWRRRHHHERNYRNDPERNIFYLEACRRLADRLRDIVAGSKMLVYAPMRGAYPIWKTIAQFLPGADFHTYYSVTSSFVKYPVDFNIRSSGNKNASGRFTNILELKRLKPFLEHYDFLVYVDEIVSGAMMWGHLKEMINMLGIQNKIRIIAVGLADEMGTRSEARRQMIESLAEAGKLSAFLWEGCPSLITEDQKFLLGVHYVDDNFGPNVVPVLNENLRFYDEKAEFERDVFISPMQRKCADA